jgi:acetate kinase
MRILVVNAGSSSIKLRVLANLDLVASADLPGSADQTSIKEAIGSFGPVDAAGHRIVHGGTLYRSAVLVDDGVRQRLGALTDLAPLHQPKSLAALDTVSSVLPDIPAVACFDTAFHASIPDAASAYALPPEWRERWALRKYGFHGLSHSYVSRRAGKLMGRSDLRIITCHLGAGASLCAVRSGHSVDTTMGFTPLDGLVMATRSGGIDPGLVLWLEEHVGTPPSALAATLEHRSGLLGLAGTADMREILSRAAAGDSRAELAREVYLHRLRGLVGSMAAAMDGMDAIVFTGGVGENSPDIRARTMDGLGFLGVRCDPARNDAGGPPEREIGAAGASARAFVIPAREDIQIALEAERLLSRSG